MPVWLLTFFGWLGRLLAPALESILVTALVDLYNWIKDKLSKKKADTQDSNQSKQFDSVVQNPNASREDRKNAEDQFVNGPSSGK